MKLLTVVGARPQFIKAAVVSHEILRHDDIGEIIVHTGQHFDYNMSECFFKELCIPQPSINLGISGGSHAQMTAEMMVSLEATFQDLIPDMVLLYGDTNSTLAGALVAAKLHIPICHIEAGARTRSMTNPEEINRICADHISSLLMACTEGNLQNIKSEGISQKAVFVGDPMYDAFLSYGEMSEQKNHLLKTLEGGSLEIPASFYYLTCHREENTKEQATLAGILEAMDSLPFPTVYPVHPRNRARVVNLSKKHRFRNIHFVDPVGYLTSIFLVKHANWIVTDSGGLQREAFFAQTPCTTVLGFEVWPETMVGGRNMLSTPNPEHILQTMEHSQIVDPEYLPFGNGNSAKSIIGEMKRYIEEVG